MSRVVKSVFVARPVDTVTKVATTPEVVLPIMAGFGRFDLLSRHPDGSQEWDLYLNVGTIHVGGRVLVDPPTESAVAWRSCRGARHTARIEVAAADGGAVVTMSITVEFAGLLTGRLTGVLADPIVGRHIEAGLEQLRHHIEYGD